MTTAAEVMARLVADVEVIPRKPVPRPLHRVAAAAALPSPLIPAELKLRRRKMPLDGDEFFLLMAGTGAAATVAALNLMWRAWRDTRTTGTLPNDEASLREAAEVKDHKTWKRIRVDALRPFTLCSDNHYHCQLLVEALAGICRASGRHLTGIWGANAGQMPNGLFAVSTASAEPDGISPRGVGVKNRPDPFLPSTKQSVLLPRARETRREAERPDPTLTRLKDARQDHEHEGQAETALSNNWQPSPSDIEAVKAARRDLDDLAIERQARRFVDRFAGKRIADPSKQFIAFASKGFGKPWAERTTTKSAAPTNGNTAPREPDDVRQWRARLRGYRPAGSGRRCGDHRPASGAVRSRRWLLLELGCVPMKGG